MRFLRTNTATIVTVGPFYDKTDGVTIETGLTITNERISFTVDLNEGSAPTLVLDNVTGAASGTSNDLNYITNCDAGLMQLELAAANVNYLGRAFLTVTDAANHCPVFHEFTILPAQVYDSLILGSDLLDANAAQFAGQTITAAAGVTLPTSVASPTNITAGTITTVTNLTNLPAAGATAAELAKVPKSDSNVSWNATALAAINAEVDIALNTAIPGGPTANSVNERIAAIDDLTQASGGGDLAAIKTKTGYLPSATAGNAGGVFIAGTNAATAITTALTANITGNLSGSVGSVTGAVGSVTGAVGSVTGAVGSVTGAVGSVTGAVGSVAANGITATSIAADAINAAAVKADAVTKIQNGLATPTNITAGTITTVTNLTNAPTVGDLTAAMKASVNAEADTALADYDGPTNAEFEARSLPSADYVVVGDTLARVTLVDTTTTNTDMAVFVNMIATGAVVDDDDPDPTATAFETTLTEATDDHYKDAFLVFTAGALKDQSRKIAGYAGATKIITTSEFTEAPAAGDTFAIVGRSE